MKKTVPYVIIPIIILVLLVLFITSKLWLPDDRKNETDLYNQELITGDYFLKVSDAVYDTSLKTTTLQIYYGSKKEDPEPITFAAYLSGNKDKELSYTLIRLATPEPVFEMTVNEVPENFYYLSIEARTLLENAPEKTEIHMDYRDIKRVDSSKMIYVYVTPTPEPSPTPTSLPSPTAEFESSESDYEGG